MPRGNKILIRTGTTAPQASDFAASEPAWDTSSGRLYVKSAAGSMVEVGSILSSHATTAAFPATGIESRLYLSQASGRLYRWVAADSVFAECGTIGGIDDSTDGGTYA
jgi:hypothetical protein